MDTPSSPQLRHQGCACKEEPEDRSSKKFKDKAVRLAQGDANVAAVARTLDLDVSRPACTRRRHDAALSAQVRAAFQRSRGTHGSPRIHAELRASGLRTSKRPVQRLMKPRR